MSVHDTRSPYRPVSTYGMVRPQIRRPRHRLPEVGIDAGLLVIQLTLAVVVAMALIVAAVVLT